MAVVINEGTQTNIATDSVGGNQYQIVKLNVGAAGADTLFTNTLGTVQNLNAGTITALAKGTISVGTVAVTTGTIAQGTITALANGTITNGTVLTFGLRHADEFATVISSGTSDMGTIKAGVSGSILYVTGLVVSTGSASNVVLGNGGTGLPVAGTWFLSANGGVALTPIDPPIRTSSGSALVYKQSTNGPLTITCVGYVD